MTRATFPYLTIDLVIHDGGRVLSWLATLWPEAAPFVPAIEAGMALLVKFPLTERSLQHLIDEDPNSAH